MLAVGRAAIRAAAVTTEIHSEPADFDSPWKEALEQYFDPFVAFFFPDAHADIDWSRGYEFLDKELQQVARDAELGRRLVDKLARVWRSGGDEAWVLIHIEVQGQVDAGFARRMYVYNYRLFDRYDRQVASFAVLGDAQPGWRPAGFGYDLWGSRVSLQFPTAKLLDYEAQWEALEQSANPFAVLVMAHLKTLATQRDPESRLEWKLRLVRGLYERGYSRQDVVDLFRFVDWMMALPPELERGSDMALHQYEEERNMPYVSRFERRVIARGVEQGLQLGLLSGAREAVLDNLTARFKMEAPEAIQAEINALDDLDLLRSLRNQAVTVPSLEQFEQLLAASRAPRGD